MVFLEFEKPLESLYEQLDKIVEVGKEGDINVEPMVKKLEKKIKKTQKEIYQNLSGWQRVQLSRHPNRPHTLFYINHICEDFIELHGDRYYKDDKAIVGGLGKINGQTFVIIGHEKGANTKMRQYRNFGMANPEGYRKSLRLMKMAEKFGFPILCMIDTMGANPGIEAEERGQAEAIAHNMYEMAKLKTPIMCYIIGEGASGGAIGIGVGDRVFMFENTWYSVISPESCSQILWRSWDYKEQAAEALKLTPDHMYSFKLIDGILKEPLGGAHTFPEETADLFKEHVLSEYNKIKDITITDLIRQRIDKYSSMGEYELVPASSKKGKKKEKD
ncbi:acetyl-CoA carboxylase carboxyltransferase subunit alpha [Membranihabitans maritimus]|uniref:acetyl-CoA carboxylase carboxyltransferase subunit alpha n=1 Tax=Membranihabitans maritimus TaxID=2904244 RepID=UPI001F0185ED|nr:acetyl-CoA carboxylase carboxyltransferase subunit alpha [Membranihabitans maritimus]